MCCPQKGENDIFNSPRVCSFSRNRAESSLMTCKHRVTFKAKVQYGVGRQTVATQQSQPSACYRKKNYKQNPKLMYCDDKKPVLLCSEPNFYQHKKEALGNSKHQFFSINQPRQGVKGSAWNPSQVISNNLKHQALMSVGQYYHLPIKEYDRQRESVSIRTKTFSNWSKRQLS